MIRMIWAIPENDFKPVLLQLPADGREVFTDNILRRIETDTVKCRRISTDYEIQEKDLPAIINWYGMKKLWPVVGEFVYEENLWE